MNDWAQRRATHFCAQFDELKGCEGIVADELRLARRWALEEAARIVESEMENAILAAKYNGLDTNADWFCERAAERIRELKVL